MSLTKRELDGVEEYERDHQEYRDDAARYNDQDIDMDPEQFIEALQRAFSRMENRK